MRPGARIADFSALEALFNGHPRMLRLYDATDTILVVPALSIAAAQRVLRAEAHHWDIFLDYSPRLLTLPLSERGAVEIAAIDAAFTVGQVVVEALSMNAIVITAIPEMYDDFDIVLDVLV